MKRQWPLAASITFVILFVLSQAVVPAPPAVSATGEKVVSYYRGHAGALRLSVWLLALGALPVVPVVALLRRRIVGLGKDVMLFGAVGAVAQTTIWSWFTAGMALHPGSLDPHTARTITDVAAYYGPIVTISFVLFAAPVGLAAWSGGSALPSWLAPVTAVFVGEQLIETVTIFGRSGFFAPAGGMNFILGAGLFLIWIIAVGAALSGGDAELRRDHRLSVG